MVHLYIYMTYTIYRGNRLSMCIYNDGWGDLRRIFPREEGPQAGQDDVAIAGKLLRASCGLELKAR